MKTRLVDGMNVIGSRPDGWWRDRHGAMVRLVESLERWAQGRAEEVVVVFERPPSPPIASSLIQVAAAPRPHRNSADDEIVRRVRDAAEPHELLVVTSDRELAARVRAAGAAVEPSEAFRREIEAAANARGAPANARGAPTNARGAATNARETRVVRPQQSENRDRGASPSA